MKRSSRNTMKVYFTIFLFKVPLLKNYCILKYTFLKTTYQVFVVKQYK